MGVGNGGRRPAWMGHHHLIRLGDDGGRGDVQGRYAKGNRNEGFPAMMQDVASNV